MRLDCLRKDERFSGCQDHVQESPTVAARDDLGAGGRVRSARSLADRSAYVVIGTNQSRLLTGPVTRAPYCNLL